MNKSEKEKFTLELDGLEAMFAESKPGTFTAGPGMVSAVQHIAVKKLITLLIRVILAQS